VVLLAGKLLGKAERSVVDAWIREDRFKSICAENGVDLDCVWIDYDPDWSKPAGPERPWLVSSFRWLVAGVKLTAQNGGDFPFSIDELRRALDAARAVPEAAWRALGEALLGGLEGEPALYFVSTSSDVLARLVYGSPCVSGSIIVAEVSTTMPFAVVDVSNEAHAEHVEAGHALGIEESAGLYMLA
jgi:hypothetical protein